MWDLYCYNYKTSIEITIIALLLPGMRWMLVLVLAFCIAAVNYWSIFNSSWLSYHVRSNNYNLILIVESMGHEQIYVVYHLLLLDHERKLRLERTSNCMETEMLKYWTRGSLEMFIWELRNPAGLDVTWDWIIRHWLVYWRKWKSRTWNWTTCWWQGPIRSQDARERQETHNS